LPNTKTHPNPVPPMLQAMGVPSPGTPPVTTADWLRTFLQPTQGKCLEVIQESPTGRNEFFKNTTTGVVQPLNQVAHAVEQGLLPDYHNRLLGGIPTPVSNPDRSISNNLG
jgi:hypothetical protein